MTFVNQFFPHSILWRRKYRLVFLILTDNHLTHTWLTDHDHFQIWLYVLNTTIPFQFFPKRWFIRVTLSLNTVLTVQLLLGLCILQSLSPLRSSRITVPKFTVAHSRLSEGQLYYFDFLIRLTSVCWGWFFMSHHVKTYPNVLPNKRSNVLSNKIGSKEILFLSALFVW